MALSRERIIEAGLAVLERDGWEGLSMRRLAQELDVWPMAVYRYFQDKDALVEGLVDAAVNTIELPARRGSWRTRLTALLRGARAALRRPSGELGAATAGRSGGRLADAGVALLAEAGLDDEEANRTWGALFGYAVGFPAPEDGAPDDFDYGLELLLDGIVSRT